MSEMCWWQISLGDERQTSEILTWRWCSTWWLSGQKVLLAITGDPVSAGLVVKWKQLAKMNMCPKLNSRVASALN